MGERHFCKVYVPSSSLGVGSMPYDFYKSLEYRRKQSRITKKNWKKGVFDFLKKREERACKRMDCRNTFMVMASDHKVFCSLSCAATVNNTGRRNRPIAKCSNCNNETARSTYKYCSNVCQAEYRYLTYIKEWKEGKNSGLQSSLGIVSRHIKNYLREKFRNECCLCGWAEINPKTGMVPLVADHIDGDWRNNREENLRLICPNCDSLSSTYGALNKGRGRKQRAVSKRVLESKTLVI